MAVLVGMSDMIKGRRFEVDMDQVTIGRRPSNVIIIDDPSISGEHCVVLKDGQKFVLRDLGSTNGTNLNGTPVHESRLSRKDIIQVGNVELMFDGTDIDGEEAAPAPAVAASPQIEVLTEPVQGVPKTFRTTSPFGARRAKRGNSWAILIGVVSLLALAALVYYLINIFGK